MTLLRLLTVLIAFGLFAGSEAGMASPCMWDSHASQGDAAPVHHSDHERGAAHMAKACCAAMCCATLASIEAQPVMRGLAVEPYARPDRPARSAILAVASPPPRR
ncbi:hypothetical protein [Hansschlegelia plantiphila]|uniref:DUF2946 domain-containing protein n=1 Tax=Hansschlegelia plantiphila TaxID=374655 RepID=A0A9W6IYQ0_9HYPH|nr:hypothetical protein [Hansschlegelia plantiphila]GLK66636.1 hypothetical protein GCM10008179_02740 [Hansschlegelia plantiphila]